MTEVHLSGAYEDENGQVQQFSWTEADHQAALEEGWYLDLEDGAIQLDADHPRWRSKTVVAMALYQLRQTDRIRDAATTGSLLHIKAVLLDLQASRKVWEARLIEALGRDQ